MLSRYERLDGTAPSAQMRHCVRPQHWRCSGTQALCNGVMVYSLDREGPWPAQGIVLFDRQCGRGIGYSACVDNSSPSCQSVLHQTGSQKLATTHLASPPLVLGLGLVEPVVRRGARRGPLSILCISARLCMPRSATTAKATISGTRRQFQANNTRGCWEYE